MNPEHETMTTEGVCPRCGEEELHRDSVHNGVGVLHGPYGCPCGWSEYEEYDAKFKGGYQKDGGYSDPYGNFFPEENIVVKMMRAAAEVAKDE